VPAGRQIIQSYGDNRFRIAGTVHDGSVLTFLDETIPWPVTSAENITFESLKQVVDLEDVPGILIIGCGEKFLPPPIELSIELREHGVVVEWMDTGAACRTFNVLLGEERHVAAALLAVP
jgi:uncharacterized protein